MQARHVRAIIVGTVTAMLASLCIWITQILIDREVTPILAKAMDPNCAGCEFLFLGLAVLVIIFALAGVAAVAWCGRLITGGRQAGVAAGIAGATGAAGSYAVFLVPWFQQQIHNDPQIYALGPAYTAFAFTRITFGLGVVFAIYLFMGFSIAMIGGHTYFGHRNKKGH